MRRLSRRSPTVGVPTKRKILYDHASGSFHKEGDSMIELTGHKCTLSDFQQNAIELVRQVKTTGKPLLLTLKEKAEVVIVDVASYQKLLEAIDHLQTIEGIRKGLDDVKHGRTRAAARAF